VCNIEINYNYIIEPWLTGTDVRINYRSCYITGPHPLLGKHLNIGIIQLRAEWLLLFTLYSVQCGNRKHSGIVVQAQWDIIKHSPESNKLNELI